MVNLSLKVDLLMDTNNASFTAWPKEFIQNYQNRGYWSNHTLWDYLKQSVDQYPQYTAIICGNRQLSYEEFFLQININAARFTYMGLTDGDNVVLQMPNVAEFYIYFFALIQKGIRPVLALPGHRFSEISYFCQHTQAKAYIIDAQYDGFDYLALAEKVANACTSIELVLTKGVIKKDYDKKFTSMEEITAPINIIQCSSPSDVAFFLLSGGTTGTPKLIPRTHNDYAYSVKASVEICRFDETTRYLCVLPAAHNFPLSSPGALGVFLGGGCVVLTQDPTPNNAFRLIEQHQITVSALVPPLALLWTEHAAKTYYNISSLQLLQVGGSKFSQAAAQALLKALNCQLQQVFGMAEGLVNYTRLDDPIDVITTTQGRPISPCDEIKVVDEEGKPVPIGEEGILLTRGPYTIRGYYQAPQHNKYSFTSDGFYRTGDIVKLTQSGDLIVTGRDKDQINRGGEKIAAEEIENQLRQHYGVHDVALIAVGDKYLGERSYAVIVPHLGEKLNGIELKRFLRNRGLADYKIPDQIHFVDELPKTTIGKIDKKRLRAQFSVSPQ